MDLFDQDGLYIGIPVRLDGGEVSNLAGLSHDQAVAQFGHDNVEFALTKYTRYRIKTITIINRIIAAGMMSVVNEMFQQSPSASWKWNALEWVWSDDPTIRGTLELLAPDGVSVDDLLAPE